MNRFLKKNEIDEYKRSYLDALVKKNSNDLSEDEQYQVKLVGRLIHDAYLYLDSYETVSFWQLIVDFLARLFRGHRIAYDLSHLPQNERQIVAYALMDEADAEKHVEGGKRSFSAITSPVNRPVVKEVSKNVLATLASRELKIFDVFFNGYSKRWIMASMQLRVGKTWHSV